MTVRCPACKLPLLTAEIDGVELDYCADDLGVWFDEGEIEVLLEAEQPILTHGKVGPKGKRRCPRCDAKLHLYFPVPDLELDMCPNGDGLWFDAGELNRLVEVLNENQKADQNLRKIFARLDGLLGGKQ